ncbi:MULTISPECIES: hypothetical protein [Vibrio]|uniref:hypothetical protein n=1 Tax=Vibrio TaxID=662 RepID=UPI0003A7A315|nr:MULTISPECIES: hypothetical protein [Vibrio]UQA53101.1 hypothetical protein ITG12_25215 [Vibrio sp. ED002]
MKKTLLLASILPFLVACNSSDTSGDNDIDTGIKPIQPIEPAPPVHSIEPGEPVHPIEPSEPVHPIEPERPEEPVHPIEPGISMYQTVANHFNKTYDEIYDFCESDYSLDNKPNDKYNIYCKWNNLHKKFTVTFDSESYKSESKIPYSAKIEFDITDHFQSIGYFGYRMNVSFPNNDSYLNVSEFVIRQYYSSSGVEEVVAEQLFDPLIFQSSALLSIENDLSNDEQNTMIPKQRFQGLPENYFQIETTLETNPNGSVTQIHKFHQSQPFHKLVTIFGM